jgi:hypothetical protein
MGRDSNKIESIGITAVTTEVNRHDLLHPDLDTNDKTLFFDGHIHVYKAKAQNKINWLGRIPVQVKGKEVTTFHKETTNFRLEKSWLMAYKSEAGAMFFVVEILKSSQETRIFCEQYLPYDIEKLLEKIGTKKSIGIKLSQLIRNEASDLSISCHNFLKDREKQSHRKVISFDKITGFEGLHFSITMNTGSLSLNDYILNKNPLYLYADTPNDIQIPIGKISEGMALSFRPYQNVSLDGKSFGNYCPGKKF